MFLAKVFPITINNKTLVIELFQNISDSYIKTKSDKQKLGSIISNLNDMASIDSFSGLLSHGFMYNKLMEISRENKLPVAMACLDIDNMKLVNDTYGHFAGDELIIKISNHLKELSEDDDIFAGRTGGDEFQVIFYGYNKQQALSLAQEVFHNLDSIPINKSYSASVSWAIEERKEGQSAKDFMNLVDKAMYRCKLNRHTRR